MLNLKGGVAKTTNTVAIAECLADQGYRILVIDADHQCLASELLLGEQRLMRCERGKKTFHDLLARMLDDEFVAEDIGPFVEEGVSNIGEGFANLHLIPCSIRIDDFQTNMAKAKKEFPTNDDFLKTFARRRRILSRYLHDRYDYTLVDCPPSLALQVKVMLNVADGFIVPCVPDWLSVRGSVWLLDRLRRSGFRAVRPVGTVWTLFRQQMQVHRHIVEAASRGEDGLDKLPRPFDTVIPNAAAIAQSSEPGRHPDSFSAKYTPKFAKLFRRLCAEILNRAA